MSIRVGVIGVGSMGASHARDLARAVSGSQVTAVFDADRERARALAGELGCAATASAAELIEATNVDAVVLASPDRFHAEQALACLAVRKPTLCEKPLAPTETQALAVLEAEVVGARRLIMMGFMRRFDAGYIALKSELTAEGIGEPLIVHNVHRNTSAPYGLTTAGTMTNMVIHELDINRWLLSEEYTSVLVLTGRSGPLTPTGEHDPVLVILRTASGTLVEIEAFVNAQYGYEVNCQVSGSRGSAQMGDGSYVTRSKALSRGQDVPELWLGRFGDAYRRQLQAWVDHLLGRGPQQGASVWDAYVATVAANRAIESVRTGGSIPITLPDRPALYDEPGLQGSTAPE